ncbi:MULTISPECIES: DUF3558 family protein [unclassified Streptomyces]|uniref:DUF3558 family protein n=1 Tax=unclassified Streptomyces TaxID=2593676 RepID=UPI00224FE8E8|nr:MULTISPECIES: DUF3558 family protein [unclassified Streptomyces]MCX4989310.1 DUF3558 domain-containing protein [Streptomyces sp. NBC_00568]MCX5005468.1 DUF3558 domain-containing protein [Streptomyces sp. NBC_00638]
MHRPVQRVGRAPRLTRILVSAAAVPVMLVAAGCSSDSDSGDDAQKSASATPDAKVSESASADVVQPAAYAALPEPCSVLSKKTLGELVPKGSKSGKEGKSDDAAQRGNCNWSSLDNNGVKGSQFRWLNVALLRFDSDTRGAGDEQAHAYFEKQVTGAQSVEGAKGAKSEPVAGTGDEATAVRYDLKKKEGSFKQQTIVTRVENVVVTLDYNGAGLAGEKTPDAADLLKDAEKAAKEAVAAVTAANEDGGGASASSSESSSSSKASSGSKAPSRSASGSASPSKSAAKKD